MLSDRSNALKTMLIAARVAISRGQYRLTYWHYNQNTVL